MKNLTFRTLDKTNITSMVQLLKARQLKESETFSFLKNDKFHDQFLTSSLEKLFNDHKIVGVGAFIHDELVGYIFAQIKFDETRGKYAWVPYEGVAIQQNGSAELLRSLYAEVAKLWLDYGCFTHFVIVPIGDTNYLDAFQRLSFGFEQVHGILDINQYHHFNHNNKIRVRIGGKEDRDLIGSMADIIFSYQNDSPVYALAIPETVMEIRNGYKGIVDDEDAQLLIAEINGVPVGFQAYWPIDSNLMVPDNAIELSVAGTLPTYMGKGIGKNLMNEAVNLFKDKGIQYIVTDWRMTNLSSSLFWPKCGFKPIYHRMQRSLDQRLAWANFNNPLIK